MFIDISGIDGCGKSTVARLLMERLSEEGFECKVFHGYIPRKNMYMLKDVCIKAGMSHKESSSINTLGMAAALMDIFCNTKELFKDGITEIFISEKYIKDSVVYMPLLGGNGELAKVYEKNMPVPDIRFILDIEAEIAYNRVISRSTKTGKYIQEKESIEIMSEARKKFLAFSRECNTYVIDASQNLEKVFDDVYQIVKSKLISLNL